MSLWWLLFGIGAAAVVMVWLGVACGTGCTEWPDIYDDAELERDRVAREANGAWRHD